MCGIFAYFSKTRHDSAKIVASAMKIKQRGPDSTTVLHGRLGMYYYTLVFHRLAINGMSSRSGQPMSIETPNADQYKLLCNGEIYNYKELITTHAITDYHSGSDCEIILHLYKQGLVPEALITSLYGVFAFVLLDPETNSILVARDPYGVRPLYYGQDQDSFGFCSKLKGLIDLYKGDTVTPIDQFPNGHYLRLCLSEEIGKQLDMVPYYKFEYPILHTEESAVCKQLHTLLRKAVSCRMMCERKDASGRPAMGAYLSGGFDSSIIAALLQDMMETPLETYSIGFVDSPDIKKARVVAQYIGSNHHEYIVTKEEALAEQRDTVDSLETYDITTNRAATIMRLLSKRIKDHGVVAVVFSGEGSDENGSYIYFHHAPDKVAFQDEITRRMKDIRYFDGQRADASSAEYGLEIREPFLDLDFAKYYASVDPSLKIKNGVEKYCLRLAMTAQYGTNRYGTQLLPDEIIWRPKEAMSDGVSESGDNSWYSIIQKHIRDTNTRGLSWIGKVSDQSSLAAETSYYKALFLQFYPGCEHVLPYYWLPLWSISEDPSARTLAHYK